jgi:hypothetical protein
MVVLHMSASGRWKWICRAKLSYVNSSDTQLMYWHILHIKTACQQVEKHARSYYRAQRAMINLGADEETMLRYKVIERTDLEMSGDMVDPSSLGQRNDALAWFWRMPGNNRDQYDPGCKNVTIFELFVEVLTSAVVLQFTESTSLEQKHVMKDGRKS